MADSIGTMAAIITGDVSGLAAAADKGKGHIKRLRDSTKGQSIDLGSMFKGVAGVLGGPLLGGLAAFKSIEGATTMLKEFVAESKQVKREAADMEVSVEFYEKVGKSAEHAGRDMGAVQGAAGKLQNAIAEAATKGGDAEASFRRLGLSAKDLLGSSTEEQLQKVAKAIESIQDPTLRTQALMDLFGKEGRKLDPVLKDIAKGLGQYSVLSREAVETFAGIGKGSAKVWSALKVEIGEGIAAVLRFTGLGSARSEQEVTAELREQKRIRQEAAESTERQRSATEAAKRADESHLGVLKAMLSLRKELAGKVGATGGETYDEALRKAEQERDANVRKLATQEGRQKARDENAALEKIERDTGIPQELKPTTINAAEARYSIQTGETQTQKQRDTNTALQARQEGAILTTKQKQLVIEHDIANARDRATDAAQRDKDSGVKLSAKQKELLLQREISKEKEMAERKAQPLGDRGELGRVRAAIMMADQAAAATKKYVEEKKTAQEALKAIGERNLSDKEKELRLEKQIVEWRNHDMISKPAADNAIKQARANLADKTAPSRAADAQIYGTEEEYADRVQMQAEASDRIRAQALAQVQPGQAAGDDDAKRAADATEVLTDLQREANKFLETLAAKGGAPTWQGDGNSVPLN